MMFADWCNLLGRRPLPAPPMLIAQFVAETGPLGIEKVWKAVQEISLAHRAAGFADPTLGGPVAAAVNDVAKIEPPRAWPKAEKARFLSLPYDLQVFFAKHERRRETEIRRAHSEAARLRQELEKLNEPTEDKHGHQPHATA